MRWLPRILLVNAALGVGVTTANRLVGTELTLQRAEELAAGAVGNPKKEYVIVENLGPSSSSEDGKGAYGVGVSTKLENILKIVVK